MEDQMFTSNLVGSSIANVIFAMLFFVGAWLKTRLNQSKCASNCYCFECETSLQELQSLHNKLERTQTTQKTMLKQIIAHINAEPGESHSSLRKQERGETMV